MEHKININVSVKKVGIAIGFVAGLFVGELITKKQLLDDLIKISKRNDTTNE